MLSTGANQTKDQVERVSSGEGELNASHEVPGGHDTPRNERYISKLAKKVYESLKGKNTETSSEQFGDEEDEIDDYLDASNANQSRLRKSTSPYKGMGRSISPGLENATSSYTGESNEMKERGHRSAENITSSHQENSDLLLNKESSGEVSKIKTHEMGEQNPNYTYTSSSADQNIAQKDISKIGLHTKDLETQQHQQGENISTGVESHKHKSIGGFFRRLSIGKKSKNLDKDTDLQQQKEIHASTKDATEIGSSSYGNNGTGEIVLSTRPEPGSKGYGNINATKAPRAIPGSLQSESDKAQQSVNHIPSEYHPTMETPCQEGAGTIADSHGGAIQRKESIASTGTGKSLPGTHGLVPGTPMTAEEAETEAHFTQKCSYNPDDFKEYHIPGTKSQGLDTTHGLKSTGIPNMRDAGSPMAISIPGDNVGTIERTGLKGKQSYDDEIHVDDKHSDQPLGPFLTQLESEGPTTTQMEHIENKDIKSNYLNENDTGYMEDDERSDGHRGMSSHPSGTGLVSGLFGYLGFSGTEDQDDGAGRSNDDFEQKKPVELPGALHRTPGDIFDNKADFNSEGEPLYAASDVGLYKAEIKDDSHFTSPEKGIDINHKGMDKQAHVIPKRDLDDVSSPTNLVQSVNAQQLGVRRGTHEYSDSKHDKLAYAEVESTPYRFVQQKPEDLTLTEKGAMGLATSKGISEKSSDLRSTTLGKSAKNDTLIYDTQTESTPYSHIRTNLKSDKADDEEMMLNRDLGAGNSDEQLAKVKSYDAMTSTINRNLAVPASANYAHVSETSSTRAIIDTGEYGFNGNRKGLVSHGYAEGNNGFHQFHGTSPTKDSQLLSQFNAAKAGTDNHGGNNPVSKLKHMFKKDPKQQQEQYERESAMNDPHLRAEAIGAAAAAGVVSANVVDPEMAKEETFGGIPTSPHTKKYHYSENHVTDLDNPVLKKLSVSSEATQMKKGLSEPVLNQSKSDIEGINVMHNQKGQLKQSPGHQQTKNRDDIPLVSATSENRPADVSGERHGFEKDREAHHEFEGFQAGSKQSSDKQWTEYMSSKKGGADLKNKNLAIKDASKMERGSSVASAPMASTGYVPITAGKRMHNTISTPVETLEPKTKGVGSGLTSISGKPVPYERKGKGVINSEDDPPAAEGSANNDAQHTMNADPEDTTNRDVGDPSRRSEVDDGDGDGDNAIQRQDPEIKTHTESTGSRKRLKEFFFGHHGKDKVSKEEKATINDRGTTYTETHQDMAGSSNLNDQTKTNHTLPQQVESSIEGQPETTEPLANEPVGDTGIEGRRKSFLSRMKDKIVH